jgi:hypothetical protein
MDPTAQANELYRVLNGQSNLIAIDSNYYSELAAAYEEVGLGPFFPQVRSLLSIYDPKKTGKIPVAKLAELLDPQFNPMSKLEVQQQLFTQLAGKPDAKLTPEQLVAAGTQAGVPLTLQEAREMVRCVDVDEDWKVNFKEFQSVLGE